MNRFSATRRRRDDMLSSSNTNTGTAMQIIEKIITTLAALKTDQIQAIGLLIAVAALAYIAIQQ